MGSVVNKFIHRPLNNRDDLCAYCLETDAGVQSSQSYSRAPKNLRNRFVQHLRGDQVCQKMHAACMRTAAQIGAAHNMRRPLQCLSCTQAITHINNVPLAQYLRLERLPGAAEEVEEEQVEGLREAARQELPGFAMDIDERYAALGDMCKALIYAGEDEELIRSFMEISALVRRSVSSEIVLSTLQNLPRPKMRIGVRAALQESLKQGNIPLLQALLRGEGEGGSQYISLQMRGEAIAQVFEYRNYANLLEQRERWRYMVECLLPVVGGRIPQEGLEAAVLAAVRHQAVEILERLLRHRAISENGRGKALYAAIQWSSPDQERLVQILLADGEASSQYLKKALVLAVSKDVGLIRELLRNARVSHECKKAALARAISLEKREMIRLLVQNFSFQERLSAIAFAFEKKVQLEIYKDLSDMKTRAIFASVLGVFASMSVACLLIKV